MSLLRRLEYLEAAKRRTARAAGKVNNPGIGPATAAFIRMMRGEDFNEDDIRVNPSVSEENSEGISEETFRFIEELQRGR